MSFTLDDLAALIKARRNDSASTSYTKTLLDAGMPRIAKKFGEEAVETVIAAMESDRSALVNEAADTFYHLLVMLEARDISLGDVLHELERRTKQSGLAEKAARGAKE
ncbi:phosphoribosyl-ATP diphosphatase [Methylocystis sp. H62]|jgi:phosphoribosyl-ATP pyrophosphohydrolase|uniref:phosphoribosyl-ATP diphosphatase n=1 Tax=Methylocystis sp. H62 TaxID=2785789 RepID=UPI0018C31120|nr:phosphoribosyl-ATP diphosphatase [Methylocystis sp. H62]MBG0795230.1 phosphoribosyl-ATP diphosphatase [Methylocystis sp. H62]